LSGNHAGREYLPFSISQNFLTGARTIDRLLDLTGIGRGDTVLEIGAGKGHITRRLVERSGFVLAVEIDPALCASLRAKLGSPPNLSLRSGDFLAMRLPKSPYKVFSNIPFCITSQIMRKLSRDGNPPAEAWLVMEKGAATRFAGRPCETAHSLLLKPFFDMDIAYRFQRSDFHPMPSVDAVLLHMKRKPAPDIGPGERGRYEAFIAHCMKHGLYGPRRLLTKRQIAAALRAANLPPIEVSGTVSYIQWLCLFRCVQKAGNVPL